MACSAKGAKCNSLGHRPRYELIGFGYDLAISRLQRLSTDTRYPPRALPWAIAFRAFGA